MSRLSQYLQQQYNANPDRIATIFAFTAYGVVCLSLFAVVVGTLYWIGYRTWLLLGALPLVMLGVMVALHLLIRRLRFGTKTYKWLKFKGPGTKIAITMTGFDREILNNLIEYYGMDINDADTDGRTLLDHMLTPMYRRVIKAEDLEYVMSLGARKPENFIALLREIEHDDTTLLANRLQAEERKPALEALIQTRMDTQDGAPRRRM